MFFHIIGGEDKMVKWVKWIEKPSFARSLKDTNFFRNFVRKAAYSRADGDPERVHEMALGALNEYADVVERISPQFDFPNLHITLAGHEVMPFGTAAGLDKNGDAIGPLSHIFGFQEVGTIIVPEREGNARPRVAVDEENDDLYNAQGFPSQGLNYAKGKLQSYRESGGNGVILASICGIPPDADSLEVAFQETETILTELDPYVDGYVWNPFSPNTAALTLLRNPSTFERYAQRVKETARDRPAFLKMGPYDDTLEKRTESLELAAAWLDGGGDGLVVVNTYMVPKEEVPSKDWGYPSAGRSGRFLQEYRQRAIIDARAAFPNTLIIATGGIDSADQAWEAFQAGADALEGYTPYVFNGFGLLLEMAKGVEDKLQASGYTSLSKFQADSREVNEIL